MVEAMNDEGLRFWLRILKESRMNERKEKSPQQELRDKYLAQCKEKAWPDFAPRKCYQCRDDVMEQNRDRIEQGNGAGITGCSKCLRSFID